MPLLWRYLLYRFFKVFILCSVAFIIILMTLRLDEIAHFATLGSAGINILWFALHQVPYILPIALPIAALISAILLVQELSKSQELTALRACGFSLKDLLIPLLSAALFLSALNFYIISELSTTSHLNAGLLKNQLRTINPLILLHSKHLMLAKGFYFDTLGPTKIGELAEDVVLISTNKHHHRLNLMIAKKLQSSPISFAGHHVTFLSNLKTHSNNEHLLLENINEASTTIKDFSQLLENKIWTINNDHLSLPLLLIKLHQEEENLQKTRTETPQDSIKIKQTQHICHRCYLEIIRRVSVAFGVFSFTLMGIAFGINISRNHSNRGVFYVILLGTMYLITFFGAKEADHNLVLGISLYTVPHLIIIGTSLLMLKRINHGIE